MTPEPDPSVDLSGLASRLETAWTSRVPVEPLSVSAGLLTVDDAYLVQDAWTRLRVANGETIVGRKAGLTSAAVQQQMGVSQPDFGTLWGSRFFASTDGRAEAPLDEFIAPRMEGEIAFLIGDPPSGSEVTVEDVLACTEAVAPAIEIIDSRIIDWRIGISDTIADNASYGGFVVGPWSRELLRQDLREVEIAISDSEVTERGRGSAALGHPAQAVSWLLTTLARFGIEFKAGDIVLSGALAPTLLAGKGGSFCLSVAGEPDLVLRLG